MTRFLYIDGACGISGDMTAAALLDLGADRKKLDAALKSLHLDGFDHHIVQKNSYSISGLDFDVHLHENEHCHEEAYHALAHDHAHRHLSDVYEIIEQGNLTDKAKALAKKIFLIVAQAEAKAHGCPVEEVHFHEVGAIDSIVDIVAAAVLFDDLAIEDCIVTGFCEGQGFVTCQHGQLPIPVPAVANIAELHGIILRPTSVQGERVTPTGIAFAAAVQTSHKLPAAYKIIKSGIGLGKRDFGQANFLRLQIIEDVLDDGQIYVVESNIDDSTAEELGLAMEKLLEAGAKDVHFEPCFMKKNRPAYILRVICDAFLLEKVENIILRHTSTIGLRKYPVERTCMNRKTVSVKLSCGTALVKVSSYKDIVRCQPEFESIKLLAEQTGTDFRKLFDEAKRLAEEQYNVAKA